MLPVLPEEIHKVLGAVHAAQGQAYVVGGALRDLLLGKAPHDWDLAATLPTERLLEVFPAARPIGGICGTICLPLRTGCCEITPCRTESAYTDHRHPDKVQFVPDIVQDLARRDFTVNAMAYDSTNLLDPYEGQKDLAAKRLRCVGSPQTRFEEDPLRILRLYRFMAQLGFVPEEETAAAAKMAAHTIALLSVERVREEVQRILLSAHPSVLRGLVQQGGLQSYGITGEHALAALDRVPATPLCRFWAFVTLMQADASEVCQHFGLGKRVVKDLLECTRLYRLGASRDITDLKMKLRYTLLPYASLSQMFAALTPRFAAEPQLYASLRGLKQPYRMAELAIDGEVLGHNGIRGEACGRILEELLKMVIHSPQLNRRETLLGCALELKNLL